jgi:hypothetical protein
MELIGYGGGRLTLGFRTISDLSPCHLPWGIPAKPNAESGMNPNGIPG